MKNIDEINVSNIELPVSWAGSPKSYVKGVFGIQEMYKNILFTGEIDRYDFALKILHLEYFEKGYLVSKQIDEVDGSHEYNHNYRLVKASLCDILYVFNDSDDLSNSIISEINTATKNNAEIIYHNQFNLLVSDFESDEKDIISAYLNKYETIYLNRENKNIFIYDQNNHVISTIVSEGDFAPIKKFYKYKVLKGVK